MLASSGRADADIREQSTRIRPFRPRLIENGRSEAVAQHPPQESAMTKATNLSNAADLPNAAARSNAAALSHATAPSNSPLKRSTPEEQGVPSAAILRFLDDIEANVPGLNSFMLLRHGSVIGEGWWAPYGPQIPHMMFSLSKSVTSIAIGLAVADGLLSVDDFVVSLLPDDAPPEIGDTLAAMRVRHLLSMSTGHAEDSMSALEATGDDNWARAILSIPVEYAPGSRFVYNTGATYLLSAILQRLTGQRLLDYLTPRIFVPLGIVGAAWEQCPRGIDTGGFGLAVVTEDVAKIGQLLLKRGEWNGERLISAEWIEEATSTQVSNGDAQPGDDWGQGYGYQFWRCQHGAYRGDGAFGQFCVVMPEQDAVLVMTAGVPDLQPVLDRVWEHLLPALSDARPAEIPDATGQGDNAAAQADLAARQDHLVMPYPDGESGSPIAAGVSGTRFQFAENSAKVAAASLRFEADRVILTIWNNHGENRIDCGDGRWIEGRTTLLDGSNQAVAATGAWRTEDSYLARLCYFETPFVHTVVATFADDTMTLDVTQNVSFGSTQLVHSVGHAMAEVD
jgi:CubicO group peptidase (beta-lactamase class C family)